jgi:uncharacterized protein DUF11
MRLALRRALAGLGLAGLLLAGTAVTALADPPGTTPVSAAPATTVPATPPPTSDPPTTTPPPTAGPTTSVDLASHLSLGYGQVTRGNQTWFRVNVGPTEGDFLGFIASVRLPKGLTFVSSDNCKPAAESRTYSCPSSTWPGNPPRADGAFVVKVDQDVALGTILPITVSGAFTEPDATDPNPANDTVSQSVEVTSGTDWSAHWEAPRTVQPGDTFTTTLVFTDPGPDSSTVHFTFSTLHHNTIPQGFHFAASFPNGCETDSGLWICDTPFPLKPHETETFTWVWTVDASARGRTLNLTTGLTPDNPAADPDLSNNTATLQVTVASKPGSSTSGTTAGSSGGHGGSTGTPSSSGGTGGPDPQGTSGATGNPGGSAGASTTGGGSLASTGSGGTRPVLYAAGGAIVLGGALVLLVRRRRGHRG